VAHFYIVLHQGIFSDLGTFLFILFKVITFIFRDSLLVKLFHLDIDLAVELSESLLCVNGVTETWLSTLMLVSLINFSSRRIIRRLNRLSLLLLSLLIGILEVSPLSQDLHSLNVLDGSQLLPVVLVTAKGIKVDLPAKSLVLVLDHLQDVVDLLALKHLLVIHTSDRVEDCPHHLWVVHSTVMVADVQAEDDLVELLLFNSDTLVSKWWWKFSQEVWKSNSSHVELTHWVVFGPSILESFDIFLLECQNIIFVLCLLVVIE